MSLNESVGWGIIGCGGISGKFAAGLKGLANARLVAAASRDASKAADFAEQWGFEKSYGSYQALAADPNVDVVYIGTVHPAHMENTLLCIDNGKNVLCEKPFAINALQAKKMIDAARLADVFLMEAMWTRFIPAVRQVRQWLNDGVIGDLSYFNAEFGLRAKMDPDGRLFNPQLGGGALLDVGIYPVSLASMVFGGRPANIASIVEMGQTGVDEKAVMIMDHGENRFSNLACSINTRMGQEATICGTKGLIKLCKPFWHTLQLVLQMGDEEGKVFEFPFEEPLNGYSYEAMAVMDDITNSRKENSIMPLAETLDIMETLDAIRQQWNLKYPCE